MKSIVFKGLLGLSIVVTVALYLLVGFDGSKEALMRQVIGAFGMSVMKSVVLGIIGFIATARGQRGDGVWLVVWMLAFDLAVFVGVGLVWDLFSAP